MSSSFNDPLKHMRDNQRRIDEQNRRASQKTFDDFSKRSREKSQRNFNNFVEQNRKESQQRARNDMMRRQAATNQHATNSVLQQNQKWFDATRSSGRDSLLDRSQQPSYTYQPDSGVGCVGALVRIVGILVVLGIAAFVILMLVNH